MDDPLRPVGTGNGNERRSFVASAAGRIDAVISANDTALTRAGAQKLIAEGLVELNGQPVRKSTRVEAGDEVSYVVLVVEQQPRLVTFNLPVLYEDDHVVAVDKPAGLAVHHAPGDDEATVADWLLHHYDLEVAAFEVEHPGIVHRLDRETSGLLLLARNPAAQASLNAAFEARTVHKTYLAITTNRPKKDRAVIEAPIGRHPADRTRMAITKAGREARTSYELLGNDRDQCLLLVHPETGRTHQIRVHLAAVNAPVFGDRVYGKTGDGRHLLHAWQLDVPHPAGGRLEVTAPLPADMLDVVRSMGLETVASPYIDPQAPRRTQD